MSVFLRILLGLGVMVAGFGIVIKTDLLRTWLGNVDWAEEHLGTGGTRLFYKLVGAGVSVLGVLIATNIVSDILGSVAGAIFRRPGA